MNHPSDAFDNLVMLQQFGQFLRIHAIILIAFFQQSISAEDRKPLAW